IGKNLISALTKAFAPHYHGNPGEQPDRDSSGRSDPVIVKSELEEIGDADQNRSNSHAVQPVRADAGLQIDLWRRSREWRARRNGRNDWPRSGLGRKNGYSGRCRRLRWNFWRSLDSQGALDASHAVAQVTHNLTQCIYFAL